MTQGFKEEYFSGLIVISASKARKLLTYGCRGYLAYLINHPTDKTEMENTDGQGFSGSIS